jgi:hypothetical protein
MSAKEQRDARRGRAAAVMTTAQGQGRRTCLDFNSLYDRGATSKIEAQAEFFSGVWIKFLASIFCSWICK